MKNELEFSGRMEVQASFKLINSKEADFDINNGAIND